MITANIQTPAFAAAASRAFAGARPSRACQRAHRRHAPGRRRRPKRKFANQPCTTIGHPAGDTVTKRRTRCAPATADRKRRAAAAQQVRARHAPVPRRSSPGPAPSAKKQNSRSNPVQPSATLPAKREQSAGRGAAPGNLGQQTPRRGGAAGPRQTRARATAKPPRACTEGQKGKFAIQPCTAIGHPAGDTMTKRRTRCGPRQPRAANAAPRRRSRSAPDARSATVKPPGACTEGQKAKFAIQPYRTIGRLAATARQAAGRCAACGNRASKNSARRRMTTALRPSAPDRGEAARDLDPAWLECRHRPMPAATEPPGPNRRVRPRADPLGRPLGIPAPAPATIGAQLPLWLNTDGSGYDRCERGNHGAKPAFSDGQRGRFLNGSRSAPCSSQAEPRPERLWQVSEEDMLCAKAAPTAGLPIRGYLKWTVVLR